MSKAHSFISSTPACLLKFIIHFLTMLVRKKQHQTKFDLFSIAYLQFQKPKQASHFPKVSEEIKTNGFRFRCSQYSIAFQFATHRDPQ